MRPIKGDIAANIEKHKNLINRAVSQKIDAVFFPELSITGYEPELAQELATTQDDPRFDTFQSMSDNRKITIGIGVPTVADSGVRISMVVFAPNRARQTYSKQQLHTDEMPFFVSGNSQLVLAIADKKIAPAICYESLQPNHSEEANRLGAEIYLASVAKSQKGVDKAWVHYPAIAKKYAMPVLMSNCVGFCDNFESAGQSAVWTRNGELAAQLDNQSEGLLIFDTDTEVVTRG
ncbi:MAG: carbon-nitrogen hydrolase family protein [Cytophagales bacterium]|nr:carbon-nitrogen hydrolase family protein [Cytophagales bacterium]